MNKLRDDIYRNALKLRVELPTIPEYIKENLKHDLFEWQEEALTDFLLNEGVRGKSNSTAPNHLMFNMATGSGKTLVMAALLLYYYKQGYRHFIFFVNLNNIVDKTENNFINSQHTKYLFKDNIIIDNENVLIKNVDNFSDNPQGIEIKFTTIHTLYNNIHAQKENQTTLDDLHSKDVVMLADEAHHLNAKTKQQELNITGELDNKTGKETIERLGWEHTVIDLILKKNGNETKSKNVLLEFTATIPDNKEVIKKYEDKIIAEFPLKTFLSKGYTKEISLLSSTLEKKELILQALLFHWYRHEIAMKNGIVNFKPVMLFRSKTIEESEIDSKFFSNLIENLQESDFDFMKTIMDKLPTKTNDMYENSESNIKRLMQYIKSNRIKHGKIIDFLKRNFQERNIIITNSKSNTKKSEATTAEQETLLNSLEDKNNHVRAIFTVKRLTEGWDVLNLFDIVRLSRGTSERKKENETPKSTIEEKQLIGRGVRYYPFSYKDKIKNKRKFDVDAKHEMRILEELFYYTYDKHSYYISELKRELKRDGYLHDDKKTLTFSIKDEFSNSDFYKTALLWKNETEHDPEHREKTLNEVIDDFNFSYNIASVELTEENIVIEKEVDIERAKIRGKGNKTKTVLFSKIENHIFRKAVNMLSRQQGTGLRFDSMKELLEIESVDDLQDDKMFGKLKMLISMPAELEFETLDNHDKYKIAYDFLKKIFHNIQDKSRPEIGTEFTPTAFKEKFKTPKIKIVNADNIDKDIPQESWYVLDNFAGTSEESDFIDFFKDYIEQLKEKYDEIYLLRNEEEYKIYDFKSGQGFQPDFLLFLVAKGEKPLSYQVFIEPKGDQYKDKNGDFTLGGQGWKEDFLLKITEIYGAENIIAEEFPKYRLIGLPFYNKNRSHKGDEDPFTKNFTEQLQLEL